ncbi:hypothetical protein AGLY_015699 [Aphis glycines]|uniref:Uncharacterized protein n=1 Tax=Aphis glycines TaxID=307491 RepID=A0A6G0T1L2_APHGL|nr:hypothetical protein AGLY_015699 [Aphis glycines]
MNVVKILAIVVVTSVVTLLCIRSGQAMSKTPVTVYNKTGEKPVPRDQGKFPSVSLTSKTVTPKATERPVDEQRKEGRPIIAVVTPEPNRNERLDTENQTTTTTTTTAAATTTATISTITAEPLQLATSRSLNGDNRIPVLGPMVTGRKTSPLVVRGKLIRQIVRPFNHQGSNSATIVREKDDDDNNETDIIVDADVYHVNNRQLMSGINDYSAVDTDISVAEEDGSAGYQDSYDASYNKGNDGTGWSPSGSYGIGGGGMSTIDRPPYGLARRIRADDLRQDRLAQGGHNGPGQDRAGQAQGVRVPQDLVPARVQAQDVPDRHVLQVPVDHQADETAQAVHDTTHPVDVGAAAPVPVLGPDARRRPVDHPGAHTRFSDRADFRTGVVHRGHQSVDGAHRATGHGGRQKRRLVAVLQARRLTGKRPSPAVGHVRPSSDRIPEGVGLGKVRGKNCVSDGCRGKGRFTSSLDQLDALSSIKDNSE